MELRTSVLSASGIYGGITQYQLIKNGIDNKTLDTLKKNKNITLLTLQKLCRILGCTPNDVVQFTEDN